MNKQPLPSRAWTRHLDDEKKQEEFQKRLLENKDLFKRLFDLIEIRITDNSKRRRALDSYEKPAWSEAQADANGVERAFNEVLDYLKFTKE